jgi:hypothetical protein
MIEQSGQKVMAWQSPIKGFGARTDILEHSYANIEQLKEMLLQTFCVNTPSLCWHRSLWDNGHIVDNAEIFSGASDYDLACNIVHNGHFIWPFPSYLGYDYRWHPGQATWDMVRSGIDYRSMIQSKWRKIWQKN